MAARKLILVNTLCFHYEIKIKFIKDLDDIGLLNVQTVKGKQFIQQDKIGALEKMIRLHDDLHISVEGIDVVFNLLEKVDSLQNELASTRNKLSLYEQDY